MTISSGAISFGALLAVNGLQLFLARRGRA
jgi:hypothetical protein